MLNAIVFGPAREQKVHLERLDRAVAFTQECLTYAAHCDAAAYGEKIEYDYDSHMAERVDKQPRTHAGAPTPPNDFVPWRE